jgi:hypothetical protein
MIRRSAVSRAGLASLDYVLILAYIVLPVVIFVLPVGRTIMRLAYEMVCVLISWPFM